MTNSASTPALAARAFARRRRTRARGRARRSRDRQDRAVGGDRRARARPGCWCSRAAAEHERDVPFGVALDALDGHVGGAGIETGSRRSGRTSSAVLPRAAGEAPVASGSGPPSASATTVRCGGGSSSCARAPGRAAARRPALGGRGVGRARAAPAAAPAARGVPAGLRAAPGRGARGCWTPPRDAGLAQLSLEPLRHGGARAAGRRPDAGCASASPARPPATRCTCASWRAPAGAGHGAAGHARRGRERRASRRSTPPRARCSRAPRSPATRSTRSSPRPRPGSSPTRGARPARGRAALVHATGSGREFAFRHPLVRRAVYDAAPPAWRLEAHERAAAALERRGAAAGRPRLPRRALRARRATRRRSSCSPRPRPRPPPTSPATAAHWYAAALRLLPAGDARAPRAAAGAAGGGAGRRRPARGQPRGARRGARRARRAERRAARARRRVRQVEGQLGRHARRGGGCCGRSSDAPPRGPGRARVRARRRRDTHGRPRRSCARGPRGRRGRREPDLLARRAGARRARRALEPTARRRRARSTARPPGWTSSTTARWRRASTCSCRSAARSCGCERYRDAARDQRRGRWPPAATAARPLLVLAAVVRAWRARQPARPRRALDDVEAAEEAPACRACRNCCCSSSAAHAHQPPPRRGARGRDGAAHSAPS